MGLHGVSRAQLRQLCQTTILESSKSMGKKKYSQSQMSSAISMLDETGDAMNALKALQKERLVVSRLGFVERAMELDALIEDMRTKAKRQRDREEERILSNRMTLLKNSHRRKELKLEYLLNQEMQELRKKFEDEEAKLKARQEQEFLRILDSATRRAIGRVKKCACTEAYLCRHNKTASYNTRRPTKQVVTYRRNGRRLKSSGRVEEGEEWERKAKEIDDIHQEQWRKRIATSIVASPWGANEAVVDQVCYVGSIFVD